MRAAFFVTTAIGVAAALVLACGSDDSAPTRVQADASLDDGACATQPIRLEDHPWASKIDSGNGRALRNVRGFHGRVYFGYGDLNANVGPIEIASFDPASKTWQQHLTLLTESVERFVTIGDELWATCADGHAARNDSCEYAKGDANHGWTSHDVVPLSIHVMDVTERVPGEVILGGSDFLPDGGLGAEAYLWRSVAGGPFEQIFPKPGGYQEIGGRPFTGLASMRGVTYAVTNNSPWSYDGTELRNAQGPEDLEAPLLLSDFFHPVTFADHIVFGTFGGYLWKFDGKKTESLGIRTIETPTQLAFTLYPTIIFENAEDHLLAVRENGDVVVSTDLVGFRCIGKAPADVRGIGALDGVVYFGGADGHVYAYEHPSW